MALRRELIIISEGVTPDFPPLGQTPPREKPNRPVRSIIKARSDSVNVASAYLWALIVAA
ncbi:hypothetical protein M413DRAFT_23500 [Hebeloma cylindrosporum]|uniref:Uncharacterized protein n=1 Tax=Hebeloma cylindrosporum TaxID=76867 RepID=A0A0C2YBR1_HEBCY|nr:hypothetical protein M413DRAFT_23500 [Hebeloma cylindrosporum h7]